MITKIKNFILLTGPDDFRRTARQNFLLNSFRQKYPDGEISRFESDHNFNDLQNTVLTPNLFASRRLVFTHGFWSPETFAAAEESEFWDALVGQEESVTLVSIEPTLDKRTKMATALLKTAQVETYKQLEGPELEQWLINTSGQLGSSLSQANAHYLVDRCGLEAWNLHSEISKLALASGKGEITRELIDQLTLPHPSVVIWSFLTSLSKKQTSVALQRFKQLLASGESVHMVLYLIMREIRLHAQLKACADENLDARAIASRTKIAPFAVTKTFPLSKNFTRKNIEAMYEHLLKIDRRLKTGGLSISTDDTGELELAIERFIIDSTT